MLSIKFIVPIRLELPWGLVNVKLSASRGVFGGHQSRLPFTVGFLVWSAGVEK